jgi:WD40 repeat protein
VDVKCADRANAHAIADATDSGAAIARGIDRGVRRTDHRYAACDCNSLPHASMRLHRGPCSTAAAARSKVGGERIAAAGRTRWFAALSSPVMNAAVQPLQPSRAGRPLSAQDNELVGELDAQLAKLDTEHPLPAAMGHCLLVHGFLDAEECAALIDAAEARGFVGAGSDYPPSYRNNDRQVLDDDALARRLFERLRAYAPERLVDADGAGWRLHALNERLRLCRYRPGQRFNIHQDGVHHRGADERTRLTFMIYLTDGDAFDGGDTLFYAQGPQGGIDDAPPVVARVRPRAGLLIVFDHALWHAGEAVTRGIKHILRSDLLYRRETPAPVAAPTAFSPGHEGYVWSLARLRDGRIVSSGRDAAIRLWSPAGVPQARLLGHRQSVLGVCEVARDRLASVSRDRCLRWWDLRSGECVREVVAHDAAVLSLLRLDDGRLASGGADARIALWSQDGEPVGDLHGHRGWVWSLCRLDAHRLLSASEDGELRLWDAQSRNCLDLWSGTTPLRSVDARIHPASAGSHCIAMGDIDGRVRLFELHGDRFVALRGWQAHDAAVRRVRWLGDGRLVSCGEDGRVRLWSLECDGHVAERRHANFATDAIELADGGLLSCGYDGELRFDAMG